LWVGSFLSGIKKITKQNIKEISFNSSIIKITPTAFDESPNGLIWVGTEGKGLYIFKNDSLIKHIDESKGLLSDFVCFVKTENDQEIWIGTNNGLNKYNFQYDQMFSYNERNGIQGRISKKILYIKI
jgi:ligand-binding sensor domain-containing protein